MSDGEGQETTPQTTEAAETFGGEASAEDAKASEDSDSGVGVAEIDTSDLLAEQTFTLPGTTDEVTVGVHSLVVEDQTMTLRLVYTPNVQSVGATGTVSLYNIWEGTVDAPVLVDRENLKEYSVVQTDGRRWMADLHETEAANGDPLVWWGVYAAPEDDIETLDLRVASYLPEFTDVPVER